MLILKPTTARLSLNKFLVTFSMSRFKKEENKGEFTWIELLG